MVLIVNDWECFVNLLLLNSPFTDEEPRSHSRGFVNCAGMRVRIIVSFRFGVLFLRPFFFSLFFAFGRSADVVHGCRQPT